MKLKSIIGLASIAALLSGCVTAGGGFNCVAKGDMSFERNQMGDYCTLRATFINKSDVSLSPYVELTVFDDHDNTIGSYSVRFDQILPGKQQSNKFVEHINRTNCSNVKKIVVTKAFHAPNYSYSGSRICEVAASYSWK